MALITQNRVAASGRSAASGRKQIYNAHGASLMFDKSAGDNVATAVSGGTRWTNDGTFTMAALIKPRLWAKAGTAEGNILINGSGSTSLRMHYTSTGHARFWLIDSTGATVADLTGSAILELGDWHLLTATYDGATLRLYVDGELDATASGVVSGNIIPAGKWRLGHPTADRGFDGLITEAGYWASKVFTAAEILDHWLTGKRPAMGTKDILWTMQEGTGSTVADEAQTHDGTITGATWSTDVPSKARAART